MNFQNQNQTCTNTIFPVENHHNGIRNTTNLMSSSKDMDTKTSEENNFSRTRAHEQAYSEQMESDFLKTCYTK